jgi:hypothetical protein
VPRINRKGPAIAPRPLGFVECGLVLNPSDQRHRANDEQAPQHADERVAEPRSHPTLPSLFPRHINNERWASPIRALSFGPVPWLEAGGFFVHTKRVGALTTGLTEGIPIGLTRGVPTTASAAT